MTNTKIYVTLCKDMILIDADVMKIEYEQGSRQRVGNTGFHFCLAGSSYSQPLQIQGRN